MSSIFDGIGDDGVEQLDENLRKWFKEKWVRFGPDGKIRGACARGDDSEGKPKCLPQKKAQNLGKKGRKYAASKKRREDPNPERTGKAKNVATKKKTNEGVPFDECPKCRGPIVHESMMNEKQDACYHKVKSRYKVWPSAYASGALVQCRKKGASNWGTGGKKNESNIMKGLVDEASGTPGGLERYRTPAMVNATMQQSLYKRELAPIKAAEKKRKEAEYRKNNPSVSVPSIQIGASTYPIHVIHNWIGSKDLDAAVEFAVNKFAYRQSKDFKTEIAGDPDFQKAVKNFFNVAEKSLNHRDSTRTKSQWDGKIRAAPRETDTSSDGFDAINKINDALLPYYKKYGVDKTGRRVPPNFNYNLGEGVIIGHDREDPQVAVLGGAGSYKLSNLKKKALGEAKQLAADIANGEYKNSAYNVKQLANTLNTIVAAEEEMEKAYFGEDYTGEFAAEKTPAINPYGGLKDNQFRGAISEEPTNNPTGASGEGGLRKYKPKNAGQLDEEYLDEGLMQKIGAAAMAAALAFGGAKANAEPVYVYTTGDGSYQTVLSPEEIPTNAIRRLVVDTENDDVSLLSKTGTQTPIQLDTTMVNKIKQRAGVGQAKSTQPQAAAQQSATPKVYREKFGTGAVFKGKNVEKYGLTNTFNDPFSPGQDEETLLKNIKKIHDARPPSIGKKVGSLEFIDSDNNKADKIVRVNYTNGRLDIYLMRGGMLKSLVTPLNNIPTGKKIKYIMLWADWTIGKPQEKKPIDFKEDTSYAGGMGQGGNAGESYRKFKPKSAGTFNEDELDEACWKGYHKEGNKKMFGKTYPNCVKNTNEDLSKADVDGIERFADKLYKKLGIDVTFTKHFMDRVNDERNGKPISGAELVRLFKKEYERWGKDVAQMGPDMEGTFKDLTTDINLPFVLRWDRDEEELDLVAKTVMRKKNFKTDNQEFPVDENNSRVARKPGQPANSKKHSDLYTDENPKGTITGLKFATAEDARASVSKIRNSGRSHAHKIQAAVAMEQRAKAAGKTEAASIYRKYINATKKTNEQQLDEKCWDTHKQVGMKQKGGKSVPNCVPKESAIMKGLKSL